MYIIIHVHVYIIHVCFNYKINDFLYHTDNILYRIIKNTLVSSHILFKILSDNQNKKKGLESRLIRLIS